MRNVKEGQGRLREMRMKGRRRVKKSMEMVDMARGEKG